MPARLASKPQYVFHPRRALRRVVHRFTDTARQMEVAELPWGLQLEVYLSDSIGFSIVAGGVFDPCVTETLHRLIDPGDVVVDVGANIGYLTSLAAVRVGPNGKVVAIEPHPQAFELLERNASRWRESGEIGEIELRRLALSDHSGKGALDAGPSFEANMGLATLAPDARAGRNHDSIPVQLARLDEIVPEGELGMLKIDVEGHEAEVLRGASRMLSSGDIRDIVFEDHRPYPSPATAVVEAAGYRLLSLGNDLFGLRLRAGQDRGETAPWPGPSYLGTLDLDRAERRLGPRGWEVGGIGPAPGWFRRPWRGARQ